MNESIGYTIRQLRKVLSISQLELCADICTQSYLSKVEKGNVIPSADILYQISIRLGVDLEFFFEDQENTRKEYVDNLCEIINEYKLSFKYEEIYRMIKYEKNNPLLKTVYMQKFFLWHEGVSLYYMTSKLGPSLSLLNNALEIGVHNIKTIKLNTEILNSIATLYNDEAKICMKNRDLNSADTFIANAKQTYEIALAIINRHKTLVNDDIYLKILNNYSKLLYRTKQYNEALQICDKGIRMNLKRNSFYHLGNLYHQQGLCHQMLGEYGASIKCFEKAKMVFDIQNNDKLQQYCTLSTKISKLLEKGISEYGGKSIAFQNSDIVDTLYNEYIIGQ